MTAKEILSNSLEYITEEQAELLNKLTRLSNMDKTKIMSIYMTDDQVNKIDAALPQNYVNKIQELIPSWSTRLNVYDYSQKSFGEVHNIAEGLFYHILKTF